MGHRAALGVLGWGESHPLGPASACGTLRWGWLREGGAQLQGRACQKHHNPKETFIGDSSASEQSTAFLTSSSCAGALTCPRSPQNAAPIPLAIYIYIYVYTHTYIHKQGQVRSRVTNGTRSQGERCSVWQAVTPPLSAAGGRGRVLKHGAGKAQASSCCCDAKQRWVEGDHHSSPHPPTV